MAEMQHLELRCGRLILRLAPQTGGSIAALDYAAPDGNTVPVLRRLGAGEGGVLDHASFPLVPYVNRIRGGAFTFQEREVRIAPNLAGDPSPLHGTGWLAPWQVAGAGENEASLTFDHQPGEWPWAFRAVQHLALDAGGLSVTLSCTNRSDLPMPCGLGLHPYFPCTPATVLDAAVAHAWTIDAHTLPVAKVPASGAYDLRRRRICGAGLDHGFGGWSGEARLADPAWPFDIALFSPEARFLHVYAPAEGGFLAVEPVTHANAALNAPEEERHRLGLRILLPGETMSLSMRLEVTPRQ